MTRNYITKFSLLFACMLLLIPFSDSVAQQVVRVKAKNLQSVSAIQPGDIIDLPHLRRGGQGTMPGDGFQQYDPAGNNCLFEMLGRASNIYTCTRPSQNQIYANQASGEVAFIHRQDVSIWGGQNGTLRYDISTDGGATFSMDKGPLNPQHARPARYPQVTRFGTGASFSEMIYYAAALDPSPSWDGHVFGVQCQPATATPPPSTEHYGNLSQNTLIPGGLCEGLPGEYWTADFMYDGADLIDTLQIYKGTYSTCDVAFSLYDRVHIPWNSRTGGGKMGIGPNMAFSPDGMTGWIGIVGDFAGGQDSILNPIFLKSTDGGVTWCDPFEVDMTANQMIKDSLQTLWVQNGPNQTVVPVSSGKYTLTSDYDITVDKDGRVHMFVVLASASTQDSLGNEVLAADYSLFPGLAKMAVDISVMDCQGPEEVRYISPILAWTNDFGTSDPATLQNHCQIARDEAGERLFYSWVDNDSTVPGLFGEPALLAPNLRIASCRVGDGWQTCVKRITDGNLVWDGRIIAPFMSPTVLTEPGTGYKMPIVFPEMMTNTPLDPIQFHYVGNCAIIEETDYRHPNWLALGYMSNCEAIVSIDPQNGPNSDLIFRPNYPDPFSNSTVFDIELAGAAEVQLDLIDMQGRVVWSQEAGALAAGAHSLRFDRGASLGSGLYFARLKAGFSDGRTAIATQKLTISR